MAVLWRKVRTYRTYSILLRPRGHFKQPFGSSLNTTKHEIKCTHAVQQLVSGGAGLSSERAIDRKEIQRVLLSQ